MSRSIRAKRGGQITLSIAADYRHDGVLPQSRVVRLTVYGRLISSPSRSLDVEIFLDDVELMGLLEAITEARR